MKILNLLLAGCLLLAVQVRQLEAFDRAVSAEILQNGN